MLINASKQIMSIQNGGYEQLLSFPVVKIYNLSFFGISEHKSDAPICGGHTHIWGCSPTDCSLSVVNKLHFRTSCSY